MLNLFSETIKDEFLGKFRYGEMQNAVFYISVTDQPPKILTSVKPVMLCDIKESHKTDTNATHLFVKKWGSHFNNTMLLVCV